MKDLQAGQAAVASRIDTIDEDVHNQLAASKAEIGELHAVVEGLLSDQKIHSTQIATLQDDVIDKVDVRSLEPLRDTDRDLSKQIEDINSRMGKQLECLEAMVQKKADVSAVDIRAKQDELDAIAEELRKRCTASEAATIQRLRELSNAIAALRMGGGTEGPAGKEQEALAGFRVPVRCISCNRPKSPGTDHRRASPLREVSGTDGRVYGHMDTSQNDSGQRRRPKSAVSRAAAAANPFDRPASAGVRRPMTPETVTVEPLSEAQLLARYGIDPNPPGEAMPTNPIVRVPGTANEDAIYSGSPAPGIQVGRSRS